MDESPGQLLVIDICELLVQLFIILEKGTHYLHSKHSISLYLSKATHLPKYETIIEGRHVIIDDDDNYVSKRIAKIGVKVLPTFNELDDNESKLSR